MDALLENTQLKLILSLMVGLTQMLPQADQTRYGGLSKKYSWFVAGTVWTEEGVL